MNYLQKVKTCFNNNLGMVGKCGGISFLFGVTITSFVFFGIGNFFVHAYITETILPTTSPSQELKLDFNSVGKLNEVTAPLNNLINSAIKNVNIGTGIPLNPLKSSSQVTDFSNFFSSSKVSSNDIMGFLKEAAITVINLTILIISITTQVLKGILSVLK